MTDILAVLPDFDVQRFAHIIPSLERAVISTSDLLSLDALDAARRAQVPPGEIKKLGDALLVGLHGSVSIKSNPDEHGNPSPSFEDGRGLLSQWKTISTLDDALDDALGGGIAAGHLTEITGESAAGKTQHLLTLLLAVQLPQPQGLGKSALYISTEAQLQTTRLAQVLHQHPKLKALPVDDRPSLTKVQSAHVHDVEAQEHILRYQVPVAIERANVGLIIIDSIAANYRAEFDKGTTKKGSEALAKRSTQLAQTGALLRELAHRHNIAVVVANQVADRFSSNEYQSSQSQVFSQQTQHSRPASPPHNGPAVTGGNSQPLPSQTQASPLSTDDPLSLDHQQRFFTGWGDNPLVTNLKTPSLGLTWTNQLSARIALLKEPIYSDEALAPGAERNVKGWRRGFKVVFCSWSADSETPYEIWEGGIRSVASEAKDKG